MGYVTIWKQGASVFYNVHKTLVSAVIPFCTSLFTAIFIIHGISCRRNLVVRLQLAVAQFRMSITSTFLSTIPRVLRFGSPLLSLLL